MMFAGEAGPRRPGEHPCEGDRVGIDDCRTGPVATFTLRNGRVSRLTGLDRMQRLGRGEPDVQDPSRHER